MKPIELPNMAACVTDARAALTNNDPGPAETNKYDALLARLVAARPKLPRLYRRAMLRPFLIELQDLGPDEFKELLADDPDREGEAGLMLDIAQAILQNAERSFEWDSTIAFQEVVADLYDGFLSAEDRVGVKAPDKGVVAPLVKWGSPEAGPYTWPADNTSEYGAMAAVVSLPPSHAKSGLMGWSALGHETAGHDILHADDGLLLEIKLKVLTALQAAKVGDGLPEYWADRIDETASDVLGILNMGPAAAIGLIGYFRGFNKANKLDTVGRASDPHPADIVRGWLGAEVVRLLSFAAREDWAAAITAQTDADAEGREIKLAGQVVTRKTAIASARVVAETLVKSPLKALEGRALGQIQDWRERDERIVAKIRGNLRTQSKAKQYKEQTGHYAAHAVAAGMYEALRTPNADVAAIQNRMLTVLGKMHGANPAWGPNFLSRFGGVHRHLIRGVERRRSAVKATKPRVKVAAPKIRPAASQPTYVAQPMAAKGNRSRGTRRT